MGSPGAFLDWAGARGPSPSCTVVGAVCSVGLPSDVAVGSTMVGTELRCSINSSRAWAPCVHIMKLSMYLSQMRG